MDLNWRQGSHIFLLVKFAACRASGLDGVSSFHLGISVVGVERTEGQSLLLTGPHLLCASADGLIFMEWSTGFCLLADRMR